MCDEVTVKARPVVNIIILFFLCYIRRAIHIEACSPTLQIYLIYYILPN